MGTKLYVGNLAFSVTENALSTLFSQHGTVESCRLITDRDTGRSKGFGFVEMSTSEEAQGAISALNGQSVEGRDVNVSEARPQEPRQGGSSGGFGGGRRDGFSVGRSSFREDSRRGSRY